ncbi:unnamed protein product [Vicia faba]|uniref:Uncharacterized protein n=1 Tax=Vicia faba TaxID=3906 RepID=A0AAV0ZWH8_VICFA|nr:unnamed protein product [Vicia faba]
MSSSSSPSESIHVSSSSSQHAERYVVLERITLIPVDSLGVKQKKRQAGEGPSACPQKKKKKYSGTSTETISICDYVRISPSDEPQTLGDIEVDIDLTIPSEPLQNNPQMDQVLSDIYNFDTVVPT